MLVPESARSIEGCPETEVLAAFGSGSLSTATFEEVAEHLSRCTACQNSLNNLCPDRDDPFVERLRLYCRTPVPDPAGERFGPFVLLNQIGEGGTGVVYKAWQTKLKRYVAVKKLKPELGRDETRLDQLMAEGPAAARVKHVNVVQIYDCNEIDGQPYVCMELMEGGSLADRIRSGPVPPADAAKIVCSLARAVDTSHKLGIVHRDLKPSNVFLTADGLPKLGDFGLAMHLDGDIAGQTGAIIGTPNYMAPEQASGELGTVGPQADIYSLGAILYEALTGQAPFAGLSKLETLQQVRSTDPVSPRQINPMVPRTLEAICLKCMRKLPRQRYATAGDLAEDLQRWLNARCNSGAKRRRWTLALVSAAILACAALALVFAFRQEHPPHHEPPDPDQPVKDIEAHLARGESVTLIGETGGPAWSRWRIRDPDGTALVAQDGAFRLNSQGMAVLELVRDPQVDHFRIHAEIRHERGKFLSEVGLAFGMMDFPIGENRLHDFSFISFDDTSNEADWYGKNNPPAVVPQGNPVTLVSQLYTDGGFTPICNHRIEGVCKQSVFTPTLGRSHAAWRKVSAEVDASGFQGTWGDVPIPRFPSESVDQQLNIATNHLRQKNARFAQSFSTVTPKFVPGSAVGLYLFASEASFRNVVVEPVFEKQ